MRRLMQLGVMGLSFAFCALLVGPASVLGQQASTDQGPITLKQVKQRLKQNNKYLKDAEKQGKAGNTSGLQTALNNYDRSLEGLNTALSHGQFEGSPSQQEDAYNRVQTATSKHTQVLEKLLDKVPEQARSHVQHAIDVSQTGHDTALSHLQTLQAEQARAQSNQSGFGRAQAGGRQQGMGRPGGVGGFPGGMSPMGGPGGAGMGHAGGPPSGGHPGGPHR